MLSPASNDSCVGAADFQFRRRLPTSKFVPPGWDAFHPEAFEMILGILSAPTWLGG
jgi:hypothetical protein